MPTPTDQERLELTASFVDEASRGIARLRTDLNQLTTGTGKAQLDAFRRGQEETSKKIKELAEAATHGDKALFSFAGKLGLAGVAAGTVGVALHAGLEGLKAYSDKMVDLGNKARVMGVPAAELKSVVEQYERLGVPAALVEQSVARFSDTLGSLGRIGSAERQEMIVAAGAFGNEMAQAIQRIQEQDQLSDKINVALELAQTVYNNRLKVTHENVADATKAENDFLALLGINPMLKHLENLDAISAANRKMVDQRYKNASEFRKALSDLRHEQGEWAADIKNSFLTADGLVMRGLREAVATMHALREGSTIVPGGESIIGYWLGRAAGLPETGLLRRKEPVPAPAPLLGETLAPGPAGTAADGSFGAAAKKYGKIFGYSANIEDRRSRAERATPQSDLMETIAANTEEMKKLNEKLALLTRPDIRLEGLGGLPGLGGVGAALGGGAPGPGGAGAALGGGVPGGGATGGGTTGRGATPSGGAAPGATGGAARGGATPGTVSGGAATGSAVAAAETLIGKQERVNNADIQEYLRTGGHGMNPAKVAWCAAYVGASLEKGGQHGIPASQGGNIASSYLNWGKHTDAPRANDVFVSNPRGVRAGETGAHTGLVTGPPVNGRVPTLEGNVSDMAKRGWRSVRGLEFRRGVSETDKPPGIVGGQDDRTRIDRSTERDVKVDMSGTLSADVNAPRGAKVTLEGGGLFNKTELARQTPLGGP